MSRTLAPSDSPYASIIGFSRAVRVGSFVAVGGTAPIDGEGRTVGVDGLRCPSHRFAACCG